jgi:hypothetical protein
MITKENARCWLPFVEAMARGETVEANRHGWVKICELENTDHPSRLRIKPSRERNEMITKENAKDWLPIVEALARGEEVERLFPRGWTRIYELDSTDHPSRLRVKPKPMERWVMVWPDGSASSLYASKGEVERLTDPTGRGRVVKFREVEE